ncbi:MAG: PaaI family thioesterase [Pirellulaceae bacterium]|nr:PaaI family thioesterase [Pirellulaceae bacterium]
MPQHDRFANAPISQLIGFEVDPGESGKATVHLAIDDRLHNPMGRVHGGVLAALSDCAMGIAFGRTLDDGQDFATIDLHIHFMRPVRGKRLTASALVRQRGLRIGYVECDIVDDKQRLIATATCSCTVSDL